MLSRLPVRMLIVFLTGAALVVAGAQAQTTWYVDDDAPDDPEPGDPTVSDPLEDGSADHPFDAIQEGIDAASPDDTVLIADGTYTGVGNRDLDFLGKAITVRSQSGNPQACIIDCEGDPGRPRRGVNFISDEGPESVLEGVTITNGYLNYPLVGGGVYGSGSDATLTNCIFSNNSAFEGGGVDFTSGAHPTLTGCVFSGNSAEAGGGIAVSSGSSFTIVDCTFFDNSAPAFGGGVSSVWSVGTVVNCTFYGNAAPQGSGVHSGYGSIVEVQNCIVAFSTQGAGVGVASFVIPTLTCCDIYGNAGGDWVGDIAGQYGVNGNISEDPLFCDPENDDFTIRSDSPCAPESDPECGLIGAWPVGCCFADLDDDGDVDLSDLAQLLSNYGETSGMTYEDGDLSGDGDVDLADLAALLAVYGTTC